MTQSMKRRRFLQTTAALAIAAFDPDTRSWVKEARATTLQIPPLDGALYTDPDTCAAAADDFGHIVTRTPYAVLVPGSVEDIARMIRFARKHDLQICGARGVGESHSTFGQAQIQAGILIDMSALAEIHEVNAQDAWVDAGVRWRELLEVTLPLGKSPATLTDYIELSIGGTLCAGGIGGQAFRHGLQVDNVLEMDVVTGHGELVRCSPTQNAPLFHAVRGGIGQFGVIVRARVRLVDVPSMVRVYAATYTDASTFMADQILLIDEGRFDYVEGFASPTPEGGWAYSLEAVKYFDPASPPDDGAMLAGLSFVPGTEAADDRTYFDFANRLAPLVAFLEATGAWQLPHPWIDMFVPGPEAPGFVQSVLAGTPPTAVNGPVLVYPFRRDKLTAPFLRTPATEHIFLFSLLRTAPAPENVPELLAANRTAFDALTAIGGKHYPIDAVPLDKADWRTHYGVLWPAFAVAKQVFDPGHVLTPGHGIF